MGEEVRVFGQNHFSDIVVFANLYLLNTSEKEVMLYKCQCLSLIFLNWESL